jgi:stage V sporulation protein D (sporulation-specific penicillin-binding protein)
MVKSNLASKRTAPSLAIRKWRINALVIFIVAVSLVILFRIFFLQVISGASFRAIAENQHRVFEVLNPKRGEIYLKEGSNDTYPLAVNKNLQMVYVVPKEVDDNKKEELIKNASSILGLDEDFVRSKLSNSESMFEILKHRVSDDEVSRIEEFNFFGIHFSPESVRFYPSGELASQTVGFVGSDGEKEVGRYGLEAYFEDQLRGKEGKLNQEGDTGGRWISVADRDFEPAKDGDSLLLTIDHTVQYEVEKIIKETVEQYNADSGSVIVIEPKTGKILAMANFPNFNPNDYGNVEDMSLFMNPSVSLPYECGSVFKAITAAVGIDSGKIEPDTTYVDTGSVREA